MKNIKPTILFVHAGAELYGADRILLELIAGLRSNNYPVHVVLPNDGPLVQELRHIGVEPVLKNLGVLRRKYFSIGGLMNRAVRMITSVWMLVKLIRIHKVDIVHSNTTAVLAGAIAAKITRVKHVWHVHEITTKPRWFAWLLAVCVANFSDKVIFVSKATMAHMAKFDPKVLTKAMVINNGIDPTRAIDGQRGLIRAACGWKDSDFVVGMIGRINWWKGQSKLMDCAEALTPLNPRLKFLFVGGTFAGEEQFRDQLLTRIEKHELFSKVSIQDFRSDIGNVLADIDAFVLPSTEPDPFPTVVLEAMAASLPVISFRHGGVCEMVEDGVTGALCDPCSSKEMMALISNWEANRCTANEMGKAGKTRLHSHFSREVFLTSFSKMYDEIAFNLP